MVAMNLSEKHLSREESDRMTSLIDIQPMAAPSYACSHSRILAGQRYRAFAAMEDVAFDIAIGNTNKVVVTAMGVDCLLGYMSDLSSVIMILSTSGGPLVITDASISQKGSGGGRGVKEKEKNTIVAVKDVVSPSVAMEVQSPLVDLTNAVKLVGDHTYHYLLRELLRLETPLESEWPTPLLLIMLRTRGVNLDWSSYARVMIELRADVELKDNIVETDIQEKIKKKAKSKQFQARSRKGQSQKSAKQENTT
ncbi:hypothetical protein Tco_0748377 [Tanacetum coccineum]|uniref:Uncharacterized protein n=1 Tax=Tanacetum coccineum TaxID=301880 RepID=A0ABQ4YWN1_9ASTR